MKNLLINGCSFLAKNKGKTNTHAGLEVARLLGLNPIPYAQGGRGNKRIQITTKTFFYNNPERIKDTFVLIGWSSSLRQDCLAGGSDGDKTLTGVTNCYWDNKQLWKTWKYTEWNTMKLSSRKGHLFNIRIDDTLRMQYLDSVLSMQDFFKLHKIKYCMYDSLNNDYLGQGQWRELLEDQVDTNRFFGFNKITHFNFANKNTDKMGRQLNCGEDDAHPNTLGHKLWANKLTEFIMNNQLLG